MSTWTKHHSWLPASLCIVLVITQCDVSLGGQKDAAQRAGQDSLKDFHAAEKTHTFASAELLEKFDAGEEEAYTLGRGDEVTIEVWDHPDLSGKQTIGPDGRVTLAQMGAIVVAGLTREGAAIAIGEMFSRYYVSPVVTVRVDRYASNHVFVLGRVSKPGALDFETTPTLLEAIARAGGLPVGGAGAEKAALGRCAIFRGRDKVVWIELKQLLNGNNLALNIRLQRNDTVYIPDGDDQLVYVLGEVHSPGAFRLTPNMTVVDALALAGGPTRDSGKKYRVIRPTQKLERDVSLDDILKPKPEVNFSMSEGDIIYVPRRGLATLGYVLEKISPFTSMLLFGSTFASAFGGSKTN